MLPDVCKLSKDISDFWFRCQYVSQKNAIVQETMQWLLAHNSALVTLAHAENPLELIVMHWAENIDAAS